MNEQLIAMQRLSMMGDWLELDIFDHDKLMEEIAPFKDDWKPYNTRKPNNRWGLSVTSLDGGLSGIPDLDSLSEYNKKYNTNITNHDIDKPTPVYEASPTLQSILEPFKPWLGRCHFLKLDEGGFFPEHYDINKTTYDYDEIRLIGFVHNCNKHFLKFVYEDTIPQYDDSNLFYFNANKRHTVFSTVDDCIMLVVCLKFDTDCFKALLDQYICS